MIESSKHISYINSVFVNEYSNNLIFINEHVDKIVILKDITPSVFVSLKEI